MKKLMIAAAIVCAAAMSQAAVVKWQINSMKTATNPATETKALGEYTARATIGSTAHMYVLTVGSDIFDATSVDAIYSSYGSQLRASTLTTTANMGTATVTSSRNDYAIGDKEYAFILVEYTDSKNDSWYVVNKAKVTISGIDNVAQDATVGTLNLTVGGSGGDAFTGSGAAITGWTAAAVPEPTSGLLLLLGVAGLALRRRRA